MLGQGKKFACLRRACSRVRAEENAAVAVLETGSRCATRVLSAKKRSGTPTGTCPTALHSHRATTLRFAQAVAMVFTPFKGTLAQHALRTFKFHAERDPIILFCCVFGSAGTRAPAPRHSCCRTLASNILGFFVGGADLRVVLCGTRTHRPTHRTDRRPSASRGAQRS